MTTDCRPEGYLLNDAYLGSREQQLKKLEYLSNQAAPETWDFHPDEPKQYRILLNDLLYTYDRVKDEGKISFTPDNQKMCFRQHRTKLVVQMRSQIFRQIV